jgi:hypothetical protein
MTLFREVYMQHHDIGKRRASFFKKFLDVRHRLPKLFMDPVAEDTGIGIGTYLASYREDVSASDCLRMWSYWFQGLLAGDHHGLHLISFLWY